MKRRFAEGNYRGALQLAEHVLEANPDDAIAEAIATESRQEIARLEAATDGGAPGSQAEPASDYAVDIEFDVDLVDDAEPRRLSSRAPSSVAPSSQSIRPTAPPGVSRSAVDLSAMRIDPNPVPDLLAAHVPVDELDAAWDASGSIPPSPTDETPSADATVALKGADLEASLASLAELEPGTPLDAEAADALAKLMYDQFVGHAYTDAIETAQRILAARPSERLALAIESQSRTALARVQALVVLVISRADLAKKNLGAKASSVLSWVDGRRSVREIATACRMNTSETLAVLDDLRIEGIIVLGGELDS